jgi:hypothetical protein
VSQRGRPLLTNRFETDVTCSASWPSRLASSAAESVPGRRGGSVGSASSRRDDDAGDDDGELVGVNVSSLPRAVAHSAMQYRRVIGTHRACMKCGWKACGTAKVTTRHREKPYGDGKTSHEDDELRVR